MTASLHALAVIAIAPFAAVAIVLALVMHGFSPMRRRRHWRAR